MTRKPTQRKRPLSRPRRGAPRAAAEGVESPRAGEETRSRILRTAFQLFHEQGYHATGVATILREAEVNAGSLYHFFPSKEALLVAVLEFALRLLRPAVMEPAERRSHDPLQRVFELFQQYREGMHAWGCRMGCPIGNLALEVADDHEPARRLIHANFENWIGEVRAWLDEAGERLPGDVDRSQLARFVLTVLEGGLMQARAAGSLGPFDDSVAQMRRYFEALEQVARLRRAGPLSPGIRNDSTRRARGRSARPRRASTG